MRKLHAFTQKPLGQVLLATILFCFIFLVLFVGLYKAGTAYVVKERARRSTTLTALTGGAVYANGLQLVRESNGLLMICVGIDLFKAGFAAAAAFEGGPPAMVEAAKAADAVNCRTSFQEAQNIFFGVDTPGVFPTLIEGQALATAGENQLSFAPAYAYNYETATDVNVILPNMALRFRTAADLLPKTQGGEYSLLHNGERHYFSEKEVERAKNPRHPRQMRVKKWSSSKFAGWWVRKEKEGNGSGRSESVLSQWVGEDLLSDLKEFLERFKFDVADRDDPPCHTFTLLSTMNGKIGEEEKSFYQVGEARVETDGLAAWDLKHPISVYPQKVDIDAFPVIKTAIRQIGNVPIAGQILKSSEILNGL